MVLDSCIVISFSQGELTILNSFLLFLITTTTVIILSTKMTEQGCTITHGGPELPPESITDDTETEYDYKYLCMPRNPWSKTKQKPLRFYGKDEAISSPLALLMGLQHAFAMIGGLITPPLVIFRYSIDFQDTELQQYAVAAALITSGITSLINIFQFPIPFSEKIFG